jgi:hypothetical protein
LPTSYLTHLLATTTLLHTKLPLPEKVLLTTGSLLSMDIEAETFTREHPFEQPS